MGTPTVYVTYNSFALDHVTGGTDFPTTFGSTHGVAALSPTTLTTLWTASTTPPAGHMVMSPDDATLYVAEANVNSGAGDPARSGVTIGNRVSLVDTATHLEASVWTLPCFKEGSAYKGAPILSSLTLSPDGTQIWVLYCKVGGTYPSGAPSETLTPPTGQTFIGSIEAFDAATLSHIGPLITRSFGTDTDHASAPYVQYFGTADTIVGTAPIFCPMAISPDGAYLYATAIVADTWTDATFPFTVNQVQQRVVFKYAITLSGGAYSLGTPTTLLCGNSALGGPTAGRETRRFGQIYVSSDGASIYAYLRQGGQFRQADASTGALIATAVDTDGATTGFGWDSFAFDKSAGELYYANYIDDTSHNKIHSIAEGSVGSTPGAVTISGNLAFSMDAYGGLFFATSPLLEHSSGGGSLGTSTLLLKVSGATLTTASLSYVPWCVLADSGGSGTGGTANTAGMQVTWDGHGRPCAVSGGAGIQFLSSKDGHTFDAYTATAAGKSPSLVFDRRTNSPRIVFEDSGLQAARAASDGEPSGDWPAPTAITGLSGAYPTCAPHPTDHGRVLMAYLDSGTLKTAVSYDGGAPATWQATGTVDTSLDFTSSGRAGLCWLGEAAFVAYRSGNNLLVRKSADGGATWGSAVTAASSGPYHGISLAGHEGQLVLAAQDASALHLWASGDLGATWTALPAVPTSPTYPAALAVEPWNGHLWFGTAAVSADGGATWGTP